MQRTIRLGAALLSFAWMSLGLTTCCVSPALGQSPVGRENRPIATRTQNNSGGVSRDLLVLYQQTKVEQTEQSITDIARACAEVMPDSSRSKVDRDYAASLLAWALNRRGEMRSDRAAALVGEGKLAAAESLDAQAAEDFKTAIHYGPANWRVHHNYAISLAMAGDYQQAIAEFGRAIELQPEYANAYFNRAELYFEIAEYARAIDDYNQAITLEEHDAQFYNSRGHSLFMLEDYQQAVADYRRATELARDNAVYLTDLADAYQFQGQWKQAAAAYQQAVSANNRYPRAYQNAAWLMATCPDEEIRDAQLALTAAKRAMDLEPQATPRGLDTMAAAAANSGDFEQAVKLARRALDATHKPEEMAELKQRLALYVQRRPYRQSPTGIASRQAKPSLGEPRMRTAATDNRNQR